jgi:hypothetical protein
MYSNFKWVSILEKKTINTIERKKNLEIPLKKSDIYIIYCDMYSNAHFWEH